MSFESPGRKGYAHALCRYVVWIGFLLSAGVQNANGEEWQKIAHFNARLALRDKQPELALRLWMLRNAIDAHAVEMRGTDPDFRSVVWTALGKLGLCPEGFPDDESGAGLWPLALHNWVLRNMGSGDDFARPSPFEAFDIGRQQRFVSLRDVLSVAELRSLRFSRSDCNVTLSRTQSSAPLKLTLVNRERKVVAEWLRLLLKRALQTLDSSKIEGRAVIEARIFDVGLYLGEVAAREARRRAREVARSAKKKGLSPLAAEEAVAGISPFSFAPDSEEAEILKRSLDWRADDWLALSIERRLFLFAQGEKLGAAGELRRETMLNIIDALCARKEGAEVESWMGFYSRGAEQKSLRRLWEGARGGCLLSLDRESGFRERAPVALQRAIGLLEAGKIEDALRLFSLGLQHAGDSREGTAVAAASRRWISYVLGSYRTDDSVIMALRDLVPREDYQSVIEDFLWRASLRADLRSFELAEKTLRAGSAAEARGAKMRLLAAGLRGRFESEVANSLAVEPFAVMRFLREYVERVESDERSIREGQRTTLQFLIEKLTPLAHGDKKGSASMQRSAGMTLDRCRAILEGLGGLATGTSRSGAYSPRADVFAGSVRISPSEQPPWPFQPPETSAPSIFVPIDLMPFERSDDSGLRLLWRMSE